MQRVAVFLERNSIPYRVVGSLASMAYGEPRSSNLGSSTSFTSLPASRLT
jgi:hypothetical protein